MTPFLIGCDHAAFSLKTALIPWLNDQGLAVVDVGCFAPSRVDYPDIADALCTGIPDRAAMGLLLCGSGIGISIAANRHAHIRAALCHDHTTARLARQHNDANVLVLGARLIGDFQAQECIQAFLHADFEGGRHQGRVSKLGPRPQV